LWKISRITAKNKWHQAGKTEIWQRQQVIQLWITEVKAECDRIWRFHRHKEVKFQESILSSTPDRLGTIVSAASCLLMSRYICLVPARHRPTTIILPWLTRLAETSMDDLKVGYLKQSTHSSGISSS
jgi:hypothetical protein